MTREELIEYVISKKNEYEMISENLKKIEQEKNKNINKFYYIDCTEYNHPRLDHNYLKEEKKIADELGIGLLNTEEEILLKENADAVSKAVEDTITNFITSIPDKTYSQLELFNSLLSCTMSFDVFKFKNSNNAEIDNVVVLKYKSFYVDLDGWNEILNEYANQELDCSTAIVHLGNFIGNMKDLGFDVTIYYNQTENDSIDEITVKIDFEYEIKRKMRLGAK